MNVFEGIVVGTNMQDTAIVEVTRRIAHPLYRKLLKRTKRYKVDTKGFDVTIGNLVKIVQTRPISKEKFFKIAEIMPKRHEIVKKEVKTHPVKEKKK